MKKLQIIILAVILLIGSWVRLYNLSDAPSSLSWDEVSNGYDGWAIGNYGIDQWGHFLPTSFESFGDDKHPVHIYFIAISERLLGFTDFANRLPAALAGIICIILIYFLSKQLFKKEPLALFASASFAISPYVIQFSRQEHEAIFALLFFLLGSWLFFRGVTGRGKSLLLAFVAWGIDLLTYHPAEVVIPPLIIYLCIVFRDELMKSKKYFLIGSLIFISVILIMFTHPALLGIARINQTSISNADLENVSSWYKQSHNIILGKTQYFAQNYISHFSPQYLFTSGDKNPRLSSQYMGEFFWLDLPFLILGLIGILWQKSRNGFFILLWALLSPFPASLVSEAPHAARSLYMMGSWHIVIAFGLYLFFIFLHKRKFQICSVIIIVIFYGWFFSRYWGDYLNNYNTRYAIEWQYGMRDVVEFVKTHPNYTQVNVTAERHQPYIFFLYYLQIQPSEFLKTAKYNHGASQSYNLISSFGSNEKYHFGDWETIDSVPEIGKLYVLTPTEYSGLRWKKDFMVKKKVIYPNGSDAYFIVSYN